MGSTYPYDLVRRLRSRPTVAQFMKFCIVGCSGMVVDMSVTVLCVEVFGLDPRVGATLGFFAAVVSNYILNSLWTFRGTGSRPIATGFGAFLAVCIAGVMIKITVMHLLITYTFMGEGRLYLLAAFVGILAATLSNFLGSKYLVFRRREPSQMQSDHGSSGEADLTRSP